MPVEIVNFASGKNESCFNKAFFRVTVFARGTFNLVMTHVTLEFPGDRLVVECQVLDVDVDPVECYRG